MHRIFTQKWDPKAKAKGPKRVFSPSKPVPYIIRKGGQYWLNPDMFSWTKKKAGKPAGYATVLVNAREELKVAIPRAAVHVLIWRWAHKYEMVSDELQVSHLSDQPTLVTPAALVAEDGVMNRSRAACLKFGWYKEERFGVLRCPHVPPCIQPVLPPTMDDFLSGEPPGMPML